MILFHGPLLGLSLSQAPSPAPPAPAHPLALVLSPPLGAGWGELEARAGGAVLLFTALVPLALLLGLISVFLILPFCKVYITKFLVFLYIYINIYIYKLYSFCLCTFRQEGKINLFKRQSQICEGCWLFLLEFAAELPPPSSLFHFPSFPDLPGPAPYASSAPPPLADGKLLNPVSRPPALQPFPPQCFPAWAPAYPGTLSRAVAPLLSSPLRSVHRSGFGPLGALEPVPRGSGFGHSPVKLCSWELSA